MAGERPRPRLQKGITFTVVPAPGLTPEERLARRVRALEALLAPRPGEPAAAEPLPAPEPPPKSTFTEEELRRRPRYRPSRRRPRGG